MTTFNHHFAIRHVAANEHIGTLSHAGRMYPCSLGRSGVLRNKKEGDGATPSGVWPLRQVLYRPDRVFRPNTSLPVLPLSPSMGWCDDPESPSYNQPIELPFQASHERLWRDDSLYDLLVVLGHNDNPPVPGRGSAIFMHLRRPDLGPTEGCIALDKLQLLHLLRAASRKTLLVI